MSVLAIETATPRLGVALVDGERPLASYELLGANPHAVELPAAVTHVLQAARTTLECVEAIVVDIGPGSFTGLRIGLAFAKALAIRYKTPLVGISSLDVLACQLPWVSQQICPLLDAKQKNVYAALYRAQGASAVRQTQHLLGPVDDVLALIREPTLFLGDGCALYRDRIVGRLGEHARFAAPDLWLPSVATLGRLGSERFAKGERDDPKTLVPLYLYPLDCSVRGPDRPTAVLPKPVRA